MTSSLDPYSQQATNTDITLQDKITGLHEIIKSTKTAMLTSRSSDGNLHSRAMAPATPIGENQLSLVFLANNVSHKFDEIDNDSNVNVSFCNPETTSWASFSGKATVTRDPELIKKHWSTFVSAWFGDLGDGKHKGNEDDPRVSVIQVRPDEIRYWISTKGKVARGLDIGYSTLTGKTSSPGEIRTITADEIRLVEGLHTK